MPLSALAEFVLLPIFELFHRSEGGRVIVEAEMAAFLGIAFWFLVGATAFALTDDPRAGNSCREVAADPRRRDGPVAPNGG